MINYELHTTCRRCGRPDVAAVSDLGKKWYYMYHWPPTPNGLPRPRFARFCQSSFCRVDADLEFILMEKAGLTINAEDLLPFSASTPTTPDPDQPAPDKPG